MPGSQSLGHDLLSVLDVWPDSLDFLASLIDSGTAPEDEARHLRETSLLGGAEAWLALIDCARACRCRSRPIDHHFEHFEHFEQNSLDGQDVLAFVRAVLNLKRDGGEIEQAPWEDTDRLIRLAKRLERDVEISPPLPLPLPLPLEESRWNHQRRHEGEPTPPAKKRRPRETTSHYWSDEPPETSGCARKTQRRVPSTIKLPCHHAETKPVQRISVKKEAKKEAKQKRQSTESPYFSTLTPATPAKPARPPAGTVSSIPFPPLDAPRFGLIQEEAAHEPFWLLIAITFLIKTSGKLAIPAFRHVKQRFPTPQHILAADHDELLAMIRHLGLARVRLGYITRYARAFVECPPRRDRRYRVRNYDRRDADCTRGEQAEKEEEEEEEEEDLEAWEIGHMTQGKYALDSWRIFCRDELLGRATDWKGGGREAGFQPEWMRTRPEDKELRAYLRWMWLREGWEWDPATGRRIRTSASLGSTTID